MQTTKCINCGRKIQANHKIICKECERQIMRGNNEQEEILEGGAEMQIM